jgi:hypothetical protein
MQGCCRDSCGCCPCKYCKTPKIESKIELPLGLKIEKKEIPYGYGLIHAGKT